MALVTSPWAIVARTQFLRAGGVLEGVDIASLGLFPVRTGSIGWECRVSSSEGLVLVLIGWLIGVRGPASIMLTLGMGGWSRYCTAI